MLSISTASMIAVSGNFTEGETTNEGIYDTPINGDDAWSRRCQDDVWDDEEEE